MILDILLGGWLIGASLMGARDGVVRKVVSSAMTIVALLLGQIFLRDAADFLVESAGVDPASAPVQGYLAVFFFIVLAQSLIYRFATGPYKIGGIADRVGGAVMGVVQGVLLLSSFLFIMAIAGSPSRAMKRDSRIYAGIVNIAPQILDALTTLGPEAMEGLKGLSSPDSSAVDPAKAREAVRRFPPSAASRRIDSLRNANRR
ncbi:MAG: CvpA family protein [Bacteroidota bacterium]